MKKFLLLLLTAAVFTACNDNDDDNKIRFAANNDRIENGHLTGTNMIFYGPSVATADAGAAYTDKEARFEFAGGTENFTLYMHQTRFAAGMPALEMRISTMPYTPRQGAALTFATASIIPEVLLPNKEGGGYSYQPMPSYTLTAVEGSINGVECRVSFSCNVPRLGLYRVEYEGKLLEK